MRKSRQNNLIKNLSRKAVPAIIFGVAAIIGIAMTLAFIEPTSGPTPFGEPADTQDKGDWTAYGRGWSPNSSGVDGITVLTKDVCDAAYLVDNYRWQWFEDGNGDGDTTDEEDGICVLMCAGAGCANTANFSNDAYAAALSWNGAEQVDVANYQDNTWIGDWTCAGNFPTGTVEPGAGLADRIHSPAGTMEPTNYGENCGFNFMSEKVTIRII